MSSTLYDLPAGSHSVSANGVEFTGNEKGQIDLEHVPSDTLATLISLGVTPAKSDRERELAIEAAVEQARFAEATKQASEEAARQHENADILKREAEKAAAAELTRTQEAARAQATAAAALEAEKPIVPVTPAEGVENIEDAGIGTAGRGITPPRRHKNHRG